MKTFKHSNNLFYFQRFHGNSKWNEIVHGTHARFYNVRPYTVCVCMCMWSTCESFDFIVVVIFSSLQSLCHRINSPLFIFIFGLVFSALLFFDSLTFIYCRFFISFLKIDILNAKKQLEQSTILLLQLTICIRNALWFFKVALSQLYSIPYCVGFSI